MSEHQSLKKFKAAPKIEENREELEGFILQARPAEPRKTNSPQQSHTHSSNKILLFITLSFLTLLIITVNYHYSSQILALIGQDSLPISNDSFTGIGEFSNGSIINKLKEIQITEEKLLLKLEQISSKLGNKDPSGINYNGANTELLSISKEISSIKQEILTQNKAIEKQSVSNLNEIHQIKQLIANNAENIPKAVLPSPIPNSDDRSFEADFDTEREDSKQKKFNIQAQIYVDQAYVMEIPKKLWIIEQKTKNYLEELCYQNNIRVGKQSGFEVTLMNIEKYRKHLTVKTGERVDKILNLLKKRVEANDKSNLKYHIDGITKQVLLLNVLYDNGGLITSGQFAMTENLSWISKIIQNQYVNRGNRGIKPKVVGFYSSYYSFDKTKENIKPFPNMHQVDKYMNVFPALEGYFIAAQKNNEFIMKVIDKIIKLLSNPADFQRERGHYKLQNLKGEDIYYQYYLIAVQTVIQDKQKEIDSIKIDSYRHFAIDYYGLYLINCDYAPYKLKAFWGNAQVPKIFESLTQYVEQELFANIGPMRYITRITPQDEIGGYLEATKMGRRKTILEGSFIQKIFYPSSAQPFIKKNVEKIIKPETGELWNSLPKIIWVFWDKGIRSAGVNNQICVENLHRMGALSGFKVNQVNDSNIKQYLDSDTLSRIDTSLSNAKLKIYPQSKPDLYRLALISRYGGIYMDASYVALESFDWLINIGKYPSQYIFNRYGNAPKVFMMWHPHYGSPLEWTISEKYGIKSQWHLAYENNFIAAEKGSQLITEWFELLLQLYMKPYSEVDKIFQDCIMVSHKWSTTNWHYLIPMDTIKCVIGRRQVKLYKEGNTEWESASDYYKIWSMSGYLGQQKLRSNTNFQNPGSEDHLFVYRYSQEYVEGLLGKVRHLVKFYSNHNKQLNMFVGKHMDGIFLDDTHPDSIFMRYMWNADFKLQQVNFQPKLKYPD